MGRPEDDNEFGLGGVGEALARAHDVEKRHESHGFFEKAWSITEGAAYGSVIVTAGVLVPGPLAMQALFALDPRLRRVQMAADRSLNIAPQLMIDVSLGIGQNLLQGVLPMLGSLAMYAGGGAIVGGAIGAVGGLGVLDEATIPGGLLAGFEIGLMIGGFMGLKDILMEAAKRLHVFVNFSIDAAELAWYAGDGRMVSEDQDINAAAKLFAVSIAELWWVLLQALIAYVMKRAFESGGQAVGKYMETPAFKGALADAVQRSSKFGKNFTDWFSDRFPEIKDVVEARTRKIQQLEEGDRGGGQGNKPKPKPTQANSGASQTSSTQKTAAPPENLRKSGLTAEQDAQYRKQIDNPPAGKTANDMRYERYEQKCANKGTEPMTRGEWDASNDRLRNNSQTGSVDEANARQGLGDYLGRDDIENNNEGEVVQKTVDVDGKDVTTRPDSIGRNADGQIDLVHDHKSLNGDNPVAYDTEQMQAQRRLLEPPDGDPNGEHVVTLSRDAADLTGDPPTPRPSGPLGNKSAVYFTDSNGTVTHQWVPDASLSGGGSWEPVQ